MTTITDLVGEYVHVAGSGGVAWYVRRAETEMKLVEPDFGDDDPGDWWPEDEDFEEVRTGYVVCVMVGDDREFVFDPSDCTIIDEDDFCHSCGQTGCSW